MFFVDATTGPEGLPEHLTERWTSWKLQHVVPPPCWVLSHVVSHVEMFLGLMLGAPPKTARCWGQYARRPVAGALSCSTCMLGVLVRVGASALLLRVLHASSCMGRGGWVEGLTHGGCYAGCAMRVLPSLVAWRCLEAVGHWGTGVHLH